MKLRTTVFACALLAILFSSCSQENDQNLSPDAVTADLTALKTQIPLPTYDQSENGIYHGVVAAATSQSRGKIWINVGNDYNYNALIELVSGESISFLLKPKAEETEANAYIYEFESQNGHFTIDLSDVNHPVINDLLLFDQNYFTQVVKSMSSNMASSSTATFSETGNPAFSGTWSLIADGSNPNPNGNNGDGITSLLIVIYGDDVEDFSFDSFNAIGCLGNSSYYPTLNSYGVADFVVCDYQTTSFAGGTAKWNLSFDMSVEGYVNYFLCETTTSGTFTWTSADGTIYKEGEIILD